jgi:hypothetical protein
LRPFAASASEENQYEQLALFDWQFMLRAWDNPQYGKIAMIDWQSHMTPEEELEEARHRAIAGHHSDLAKLHFHQIRLIAQRCRQRARKAKEE